MSALGAARDYEQVRNQTDFVGLTVGVGAAVSWYIGRGLAGVGPGAARGCEQVSKESVSLRSIPRRRECTCQSVVKPDQ